jgi:hypothetical protein
MGGRFKNTDNVITETDPDGLSKIRFVPVSAFETPEAVDRLTTDFIDAIQAEKYDPLLLIPIFSLDFQ